MQKFNKWFHATWISILAGVGIQVHRPATMDTSTPPAIVRQITAPTPSPTPIKVGGPGSGGSGIGQITVTATSEVVGGAGGKPVTVTFTTSTPSPSPTVSPTPTIPTGVLTQYPQMVAGDVVGATDEEKGMVVKATAEANQVLRSDCFKNAVLNGSFTERNVWDTTNQLNDGQIMNLLAQKPITFGVNIFYGSWKQNYVWKTMGYDVGDGVVYMNRFYADTPEIMGSLMIHEAEGHGQGFHHYDVFDTSVPYQFNDFFDLCLGKK